MMNGTRLGAGKTAFIAFVLMALSSSLARAQWAELDASEAPRRVSSHLGRLAPSLMVSRVELSCTARDAASWPKLVRDLDAGAGEIVEFLPDRLTVVLRYPEREFTANLNALRADPRVEHAFAVHHIGEEGTRRESRYLLTRRIVVAFDEGLERPERDAILGSLGADSRKDLEWLPGAILAEVRPGVDPIEVCGALARSPQVRAAHPDWVRYLGLRDTYPADPLFGNQWHLLNTGQGNGSPGADIGAVFAWDLTLGAGTTIAVIDTGVDAAHPDLNQTASGYNPTFGAGPGMGQDLSGHGTRVAGVAAATGGNGTQVSGVSWQSLVMPIRLLNGSGYGTPSEEAACFVYAADNGADVITNSWGPDGVPFPLPFVVEQAFIHATNTGRGGLGTPIFWAAGNGNEDIITDEYVASTYTISVGATTNFDSRAPYSDFGAALDLVAPSSGGTRAINTTDLGGGTTLMFGGTSASAPQAAGVAALMLSANPNLDWMALATLMRDTANPIQPGAAGYDATGHSIYYGHGRLDAQAAVAAAIAAAPTPPALLIYSWGIGDINILITGMPSFAEWALGVSSQLYDPIGSGPIFGLGTDSLQTFLLPAGAIPFRFWADVNGEYYWGAMGIPPGLVFQAAAVTRQADGSLTGSNVLQVVL
jgi:subtilisin family serine protease